MAGSVAIEARTRADSARRMGLWRAGAPSYSFAVVVGGIYVSLGPTVGAVITIMLAEVLRISFGTRAVGWDNLVYGVLLVLFIVFLPKGILGSLLDLRRRVGWISS